MRARCPWRHRATGATSSAAATADAGALSNNAYSGDAIAIADAATVLANLPVDLANDNALPRWLRDEAGVDVRDLRGRRHLAVDIDSPLDLLLLDGVRTAGPLPMPDEADAAPVRERLARMRALAADAAAELLVAGRMAATDLRWLERRTRARTRALIEERGMRTATLAALRGTPNARPPRSTIGTLLERDGPEALGDIVGALSDGALRGLQGAARAALRRSTSAGGRDPRTATRAISCCPSASTTHGSRSLTASALDARVPVLLGGHTLVGPGVRSRAHGGARGHDDGARLPPRGAPGPRGRGRGRGARRRIRAEIAEHGPITFARFMERALYEPGHGYYRQPEAAPGRGGDFLTAPETHPIFGAVIGRLLEQAWEALGRPEPFTVTEPGAGTGALAAGLLGGLRELDSPLLEAIRYRPVEVEPARLDALRARLIAAGLRAARDGGTRGRDRRASSPTRCSMRCRSTG